MLRKLTSITLLVSIIALGISGMLMIFLDSLTFQLQMHPVHKIFGIIMCGSALFHIYFNISPIKSYLKLKQIAIGGTVLSGLLILLFAVGMNKPINQEIIGEIEVKMSQLEKRQ